MNFTMHQLSDTIVALATPPGLGAIGVIRLSGPQAINIVASKFQGKNLKEQPSHTVHVGTLRNDEGRVLDEVVVTLFLAPHSYTGEEVVEVSCHGSPYILQQAIQLFIQQGARLAQPGEFTLRAFLNEKMDLSQAEAVADLIAANSEMAHKVAMQQMRGGFSKQIAQLRHRLIHFASLLELELDFSEEDVEFANRAALKNLVGEMLAAIEQLVQSFRLGNVLRRGVPTVIAGRPNAGKSTLLNALLAEERAIVSDIPGTTRDTVEEVLNIHGVEFRLIDTAGIRQARDQVEAIGVQKTLEKIRLATLLLYIFDTGELSPMEVVADLIKLVHTDAHLLVVANKMDKNPAFDPEALRSAAAGQLPLHTNQIAPISALHSTNIASLREKLFAAILAGTAAAESSIVTNVRHLEALEKAAESLQSVLTGFDMGLTTDLIALDLRRALYYLGEITGEVGVEDLLDNIFSKFCIGK